MDAAVSAAARIFVALDQLDLDRLPDFGVYLNILRLMGARIATRTHLRAGGCGHERRRRKRG